MQPHLLTSKRLPWRPLLLAGAFFLCLCCGLLGASYALADDPVLVPDAPGSISGVVTDGNGALLAGIEVSLYLNLYNRVRTVSTDANGFYKATILPTGLYRIGFRDPKGVYATEYYKNAATVDSASDVPVAGQEVTGINKQLSFPGTISGTIRFTGALSTTVCSGCGTVNAMFKSNNTWQIVASTSLSVPSGIYSVTGLPTGLYRLCLSPYIYPSNLNELYECYDNVATGVDNAQDIPVIAGQVTPNINFVLGDGADFSSLGGLVTSATGEPLEQINVSIDLQNSLTERPETGYEGRYNFVTHTDRSGHYLFDRLLPGAYVVKFTDGYGPYLSQYYNNTTQSAFAEPIVLGRKEQRLDINARLAAGGRITGTVSVLNQLPASGYVELLTGDVQPYLVAYPFIPLDPQTGNYNSGGIAPGSYWIVVNVGLPGGIGVSGYYGGSYTDPANKVVVGVGETRSNINITVGEGVFERSIEGQVTAEGLPKAGIKVTLYPNQYPHPPAIVYTYTNSAGNYTIGGLVDNNSFLLGFSDPAGVYATTYYSYPLSFSTTRFVISDTNMALQLGGAISGHVSLHSGKPVSNTVVAIYTQAEALLNLNWLQKVTTDANGDYIVKGLLPGIYRVCFTDSQSICYNALGPATYLQAAADISVLTGAETKEINVVLGSAGPGRLYLPQIAR